MYLASGGVPLLAEGLMGGEDREAYSPGGGGADRGDEPREAL